MKSIVILLTAVGCLEAIQRPCIPRSFNLSSVVCVCNATYCDDIPPLPRAPTGYYLSYTSSQSGIRMKLEEAKLQPISKCVHKDVVVTIDPRKAYQKIFGWGGAFTDSTGINIYSLSRSAATNLLKSYFSKAGLEYNLCRVPIGGTDFSTHGYSYDDGEPDPQLVNFKLAFEDFTYKIPLMKAAMNLTKGDLKLIASAWTAPIWMKHNGRYTGRDVLRPEMYQSWADYMLKFLEAYDDEGISFWGITTGNEPSTGLQNLKINSVGWHPEQMGTWISEYFGPTIRNSLFSDIKIMALDDQSYYFSWYIDKMLNNSDALEYIDGFAVHWYWNPLFPQFLLSETHDKYPDKFILSTEASTGVDPSEVDVLLGDWGRAEDYSQDIIRDLNNWVTGWVDWNMALNETGGPTYIDNELDSPIIVNARNDEFYKQPMYYALAHFSKLISRGSQRIYATNCTSMELVALRRPDDGKVIVVLNKNDHEVPLKLQDAVTGWEIQRNVPSKSIISFIYW